MFYVVEMFVGGIFYHLAVGHGQSLLGAIVWVKAESLFVVAAST